MSEFSETIEINASPEIVWAVLADVGTIAEWNPGLVGSRASNDTHGVGAMRYCDIDGRQSLDEEVVRFDPLQAITFRITRSTLPFRRADIRFSLSSRAGRTTVAVSPDYQLKYGLIGRLLDRVVVARAYRKGMKGLLSGLKDHTEQLALHESRSN